MGATDIASLHPLTRQAYYIINWGHRGSIANRLVDQNPEFGHFYGIALRESWPLHKFHNIPEQFGEHHIRFDFDHPFEQDASTTIAMEYTPLESARQEIRLVTVAPDQHSADIHCTLAIVSLLQDPVYEALSYTWGDETKTTVINVEGSPFDVTTNLATALRHLRKPDEPRVLWIDALSINQKDIPEKNSQVPQMGNIYRRATTVIAWLGESQEDGQVAFDTFLALSEETADGKHWGEIGRPNTSSYALEAKDLKAVIALVARPWWRRIWTVQELILATKLVFVCGNRKISAEVMFQTSDNYFAHVQNCCEDYFRSTFDLELMLKFNESMATVDRLGVLREDASNLNLGECVRFFRHRQSKDPRDMIYGLLGLAPNLPRGYITPNYNSSVSRVFQDAAFTLIVTSNSLRILSNLFHQPKPLSPIDGSLNNELLLPSWVPDWSTSWPDEYISQKMIRDGFQQQHFNAGGRAGPRFFAPDSDGGALFEGLIIGEIKALTEPRPPDSQKFSIKTYSSWQKTMDIDKDPDALYPYWWSENGSLGHPYAVYGYPSWLDAFYQTLCSSIIPPPPSTHATNTNSGTRRAAYNDKNLLNAWVDFASKEENLQEAKGFGGTWDIPNAASRYPAVHLHTFWTYISASTLSRRMFRMSEQNFNEEWLGLAPNDARIGDCVAVLAGGRVPYILRNRRKIDGSQSGSWELIGDAYVHGIMDGEAMKSSDKGFIFIQ